MIIKLPNLRIMTARRFQDSLARSYRMAERGAFEAGYVRGALNEREGKSEVEFYSPKQDHERIREILHREGLVE